SAAASVRWYSCPRGHSGKATPPERPRLGPPSGRMLVGDSDSGSRYPINARRDPPPGSGTGRGAASHRQTRQGRARVEHSVRTASLGPVSSPHILTPHTGRTEPTLRKMSGRSQAVWAWIRQVVESATPKHIPNQERVHEGAEARRTIATKALSH